jgi:ZIP family zinc transporter
MGGAAVVAAGTLAGAWLARRRQGQEEIWLGASAGALLVIAGLHLLPDAWSGARAAGLWPWAVPVAACASFTVAALAGRRGCTCCSGGRAHGAGKSTAAALIVHRFLEGSALALAGSAAVVAGLAVHSVGEGLAAGALLGGPDHGPGDGSSTPGRRHELAVWLAAMCASPVAGAVAASAYPLPPSAGPVLIAAAAGILAQAARVSLRAALRRGRPGWLLTARPAAAAVTAALITAMAVHAIG